MSVASTGLRAFPSRVRPAHRVKVVHGMHPTELCRAPRYTTEEIALEPITILCSHPSFLRKQESRPLAPRFLDAGSSPA